MIVFERLKAIPPDHGGGLPFPEEMFPLTTVGVELRFDVRRLATASVYVRFNVAASTAALTVYRSIDGVNAVPLEDSQILTAAAPMSDTIDVAAIAYLHVRTTTAASGEVANVQACGKADS